MKLQVDFTVIESAASPTNDSSVNKFSTKEAFLKSKDEKNALDYETLRQKYDSIVDFTVHLTSERDALKHQLEEVKKERNAIDALKRHESSSSALSTNSNHSAQVS